jgi:hypothetical protein
MKRSAHARLRGNDHPTGAYCPDDAEGRAWMLPSVFPVVVLCLAPLAMRGLSRRSPVTALKFQQRLSL